MFLIKTLLETFYDKQKNHYKVLKHTRQFNCI